MNETRNELLNLSHYVITSDKIYLDMLLENYKSELERQKEEAQNKLKEASDNLELLELIKERIKKGSGKNGE